MTCSRDKSIRIYEIERKGRCIKILSFSQSIGKYNMQFRGGQFYGDKLYTLGINTKGPSVVNVWDCRKDKYLPVKHNKVHDKASSCLSINSSGSQIAIGSGDGYAIAVDAKSLEVYRKENCHRKAPVTSISFTGSERSILTSSNDRTNYFFTSNSGGGSSIGIIYWICVLILGAVYGLRYLA